MYPMPGSAASGAVSVGCSAGGGDYHLYATRSGPFCKVGHLLRSAVRAQGIDLERNLLEVLSKREVAPSVEELG